LGGPRKLKFTKDVVEVDENAIGSCNGMYLNYQQKVGDTCTGWVVWSQFKPI